MQCIWVGECLRACNVGFNEEGEEDVDVDLGKSIEEVILEVVSSCILTWLVGINLELRYKLCYNMKPRFVGNTCFFPNDI